MSVPKMHAVAMQDAALDLGCLKWAFTAGAPLAEDAFSWYAKRGIPVYEGWGLTECSPSATITPPGDRRRAGVVGQPIPGVAVGVECGSGRILVRGPNVMLGYHRRPSPCLAEGVLDSGDLGAWTDDGLKLLGRADHMLKLANGEKAHAPAIEARLEAQAAVHHAIVAVDDDLVALLEPRSGLARSDLSAALAAANADQPVPYLRVARAYAIAHPLTIENGHLTTSMKVARGNLLASWREWMRGGGNDFERIL
jgi:long-chain acyl-CoA synthetase